jgi:hypothetical protein
MIADTRKLQLSREGKQPPFNFNQLRLDPIDGKGLTLRTFKPRHEEMLPTTTPSTTTSEKTSGPTK